MAEHVLDLQGISRSFGAVHALERVDLSLAQGEVLGLMGDNGAGKSTLVKIIAGNFPPSTGTILLDGEEVSFHSPLDARKHGIEIVYQDLALCNNLSAALNVFLGRELTRGFGPIQFIDRRAMTREIACTIVRGSVQAKSSRVTNRAPSNSLPSLRTPDRTEGPAGLSAGFTAYCPSPMLSAQYAVASSTSALASPETRSTCDASRQPRSNSASGQAVIGSRARHWSSSSLSRYPKALPGDDPLWCKYR